MQWRALHLGCTQWRAPVRLERAERDRICARMESDRHDAGQWRQQWHAALVGRRARRVGAGAPGAPGDSPIAQGESRWPLARPLRGRWRYQRLGAGERRASAYPAAGPALRAVRYLKDPEGERNAEGDHTP